MERDIGGTVLPKFDISVFEFNHCQSMSYILIIFYIMKLGYEPNVAESGMLSSRGRFSEKT